MIDLDAQAHTVDPATLPEPRRPLLPNNSAAVARVRRVAGDRPSTPNQDRAIDNMLRKLRHHNAEVWMLAHAFVDDHRPMTFEQASETITRLRRHLDAPEAVTVTHTAPERANADSWAEWHKLAGELAALGGKKGARFAIDTEPGAANRTAFWAIVPSTRQAGRFWLRQVIGGAGAVYVRMSPEAMLAVGRKIAADPKSAMLRYGQELGECGHCGRTLTNDESRAAGIGPVCARRKGW